MKITERCRKGIKVITGVTTENFWLFASVISLMIMVLIMVFIAFHVVVYVLGVTAEVEYEFLKSDEHQSRIYCDLESDREFKKYIIFTCSDQKIIKYHNNEEGRWLMQKYAEEQ